MANQKLDSKQTIKQAIEQFGKPNQSLTKSSLDLFQALGYNTDRQSPLNATTYQEFQNAYILSNLNSGKFSEERAQVKDWRYIDLLFQITSDELKDQLPGFTTQKVDDTIIESYLFFTLELSKDIYSRSALSQITREINKLFPMPVMVLFRYASNLSLAIIDRRLHKKDEQKDVLIKVTLIKDINIQSPHRAHIEILFDLSLDELSKTNTIKNFTDLQKAWKQKLNTKALNEDFYKKLFNWYLWALHIVKFPQIRPSEDMIENEIYQSESLIRLITRVLFVWFMKEKRLIKPELFDKNKLQHILKNFTGSNGEETIYYKAILQNLFFATLNTPIEKRKVIGKEYYNPTEYGNQLVYRFDELFQDPANMISHFENIPFLNGGLFECLDQRKDKDNPVEIRLDGFSTKKYKQAELPDKLFFGEYSHVDLHDDYNDSKKSNETVLGLMDILNQYKFTIEENTPIEEEIALDPELLGKVFENLLASYNKETKATARNSTGSFYTPREIVNYMVDESLTSYLKNYIKNEAKIRNLLSYHETTEEPDNQVTNQEEWTEIDKVTILKAIDQCKILDPACGSGAFPMGVLHKMIHVLSKLDPENKIWFDLVINNFPAYMKEEVRKRLQKENWNYVRKLGIIQQCIYGVDIQSIAIQIAKLRFFISLLVDQNGKPDEPNFGFDPLPNLDFKLVSANTLISAPKFDTTNTGIFENIADPFFEKYNELTEKYFSAYEPEEKLELKTKITLLITEKCNQKIKEIESKYKSENEIIEKGLKLKHQALIEEKENEIKLWQSYKNLFKQESVGFFEPHYFFPKTENDFDIILGNPPYIQLQKDHGKLADLYQNCKFETFERTGDIYSLFYEKGIQLLKTGGYLCYITSNKWMRAGYGKSLRNFFNTQNPITLIDLGPGIFENATVDTNIMLIQKEKNRFNLSGLTLTSEANDKDLGKYIQNNKSILPKMSGESWFIGNQSQQSLKEKIEQIGIPLKEWDVKIYYGIKTGLNEAFIIDQKTRNRLIAEDPNSAEILKPILRGRDIKRYSYDWAGLWLIQSGFDINVPKLYPAIFKHLEKFKEKATKRDDQGKNWWNLRACSYYDEFEKEKIIWQEMSQEPSFSYDIDNLYCNDTGRILIANNIKFLLAIFNSRLFCYAFSKFYAGGELGAKGIRFKHTFMEKFPIPPITEINHPIIDQIENLVEKILELKKQKTDTKALESEIDLLVYQLYDLTPTEIKIVEGKEANE